jgi:NAD(P)H dehydrogenase (quinone)
MAEIIARSMNDNGLPTDCKSVDKASVADMTAADAIVMGSPTYYGQMAPQLMQLLTDSVSKHGQLAGKVGGAFASSANIGGGNETTILGILEAMLIHGMISPANHSATIMARINQQSRPARVAMCQSSKKIAA